MDERHAAGRVPRAARRAPRRSRRRERRSVPPTTRTRRPAGRGGTRSGAIEELRALEGLEALDLQRARLERADAAGDDDRVLDEARPARGRDVEAAVVAARDQRAHLLVEVKAGAERLDLLEQPLGQLAAGARPAAPGCRRSACRRTARRTGRRRTAANRRRARLISSRPSSNTWNRPTGPGADDDRVGLDRVVRSAAMRAAIGPRRRRPI